MNEEKESAGRKQPIAQKGMPLALNTLSPLTSLVAVVVILSLLEALLIIIGILPPVLKYSPGNVVFSLAQFAVIVYAGVVFAPQGLKKAASNGAILAFAMAATLCVVGLISSALFRRSVLGLSSPNIETSLFLFIIIIIENAILGAVVAAIAAFAANFVNKKRV